MRLLASRTYPFVDRLWLEERLARDTLFRTGDDEFLLYMETPGSVEGVDRLVRLNCRAALLWINETTEEFGMEWE